LTPFANRKEECERQKKMSRKFVNQAAKVCQFERQTKISIELISQAAITSLVVKKTHVVFEQLDLNFK